MSPIRLFSPEPLKPHHLMTLDASQARYLMRALRLRAGNTITLFDGSGGEYVAEIVSADKGSVEVQTGAFSDRSAESTLQIRLVQGISKGDRMDTVVQKATELGATRISPVLSQYSVVRLDDKKATKRRDHWQKIAQSTCEQCCRNIVPCIGEVKSLDAWHCEDNGGTEIKLILIPDAKKTLSSIRRPESGVSLLVGPEGGFSGLELERAMERGFTPVSLGPRILRTETAAAAAISVVQTLWGDFA